jgi:hypothetical protein
MARALRVSGLLLVLLSSLPARAAITYCVGGYTGTPPNEVAACALPEVTRLHDSWHEHMWLTDGKACFICYDEVDSTCQTIFLQQNPQYAPAEEYDCARLFGEGRDPQVMAHVIDGQPVAPPPPPPKPVELEARLEHITPGPYTAGDSVRVVGAVRDDKGALRRITGGSFRLVGADGQATVLPGTVQPDGSVVATFKLPPTASAHLEFVPDASSIGKGEVLRASASAPQSLQVEVCAFRARVVQPAPYEALVAGQRTLLTAVLTDAADEVPITSPPAGLSLEFTLHVEGEPPQRVPANETRAATWTPPPSPKPRTVRISAGGRAGEQVVCPAREVAVTVSDLGLGFDTSELPTTCYVGVPCRGVVTLQRPAPGPGRQQVDTLLGDAQVVARMLDTGEERFRGAPRTDDRYAFSATYTEPKSASWSIVFETPRGPVTMPPHEVRVRPALRLALPEVLDFGALPAGSAGGCQKLDFSSSQAVEEHAFLLRAEGLMGCQARPVLFFKNPAGGEDVLPLEGGLTVDALDPKDRRLDVCLQVPRCAGEVSPDSAVLKVEPRNAAFASQARTVRLRWKVEGRGFLACHGLWIWPAVGLFGLAFLVAGFTRPARFPPGASLRVAGSERGMRQAAVFLLRDCPGSSAGFFRDARLGLHGDGDVNGRTRNALIVLRAERGAGVVLEGQGPLEQQDRRTLKWEPVEDLARGHLPAPSVLYRAGGTFFKLEL